MSNDITDNLIIDISDNADSVVEFISDVQCVIRVCKAALWFASNTDSAQTMRDVYSTLDTLNTHINKAECFDVLQEKASSLALSLKQNGKDHA